MNYREKERQRATALRDELFRDPGMGDFKKTPREFVLSDPGLNLWGGIRDDALAYFTSNSITWWDSGNEPTGHLLSSQIACINHLYPLRQREDLATVVLRTIRPDILRALPLDTGFVEFEVIGKERLGGERAAVRGANCTSVDAMMLGEMDNGQRILFPIEWKYTESYSPDSKIEGKGKSGETRWDSYEGLLKATDSPIQHEPLKDLFYEPFYQLMRQVLLANEMIKRREYGATDWVHVHVIPNENTDLINKITSPGLNGDTIGEAWKTVLRQPEKYVSMDPKDLVAAMAVREDTQAITQYLMKRYG